MPRCSAPDSLSERCGRHQAELVACALNRGNISEPTEVVGPLPANDYLGTGCHDVRDESSQTCDPNRFVGSNVVGSARGSAIQDLEKPSSQIALVEIRPNRRSVAVDLDGTPSERVPDEIADSEVRIQRQIITDEGEESRNLHFQSPLRGQRAQLLGQAFCIPVSARGVGRIGRAGVILSYAIQPVGLPPINGARTEKEHFRRSGSQGEIENMRRTLYDRIDELTWVRCCVGRRVSRCMNDVAELFLWPFELSYIAAHQLDMTRKIWESFYESFRPPREN